MFKLNPKPTFTAPVALSVPGMSEPLEVTFTFRHQNKTALAKWVAEAATEDSPDALHKVIASWSGIKSDDGADSPYSLTALSDLLENYSTAQGEIFRAYLKELTEAKRKN